MLDLRQNHSIVTGPQHRGDTEVTSGQLYALCRTSKTGELFHLCQLNQKTDNDFNWYVSMDLSGFPGCTSGKEPSYQCRRHKRHKFNPWVGKIPWRRAWQPTPVFLPGESAWTEEPGGLSVHGVTKSQTWLKQLSRHQGISISHVVNQYFAGWEGEGLM